MGGSWFVKPLKATLTWLRSTKAMNKLVSHGTQIEERQVHDGILWCRIAESKTWQPCCLKCTGANVIPLQARKERVAFVAYGTAVRAHHVFVKCGGCKDYKYIPTDEYEKLERGIFD